MLFLSLGEKISGKKENDEDVKRSTPLGRSWHSLTKIDTQNIFLYGGLSQDDDALGEIA